MKHLKKYKIYESKKSLIDNYLSKMDTDRQYIIDIFQDIVDLGHEPNFEVYFLDNDGRKRKEKLTAHETPILAIKFSSDRERYVGGSIKFNNLNYLEALYHSLHRFISIFKSKCKIHYELDNMIELCIICQFDTEYDETKVSLSNNDIHDALSSCKSLIKSNYSIKISDDSPYINLYLEPGMSIYNSLIEKLKAERNITFTSNEDDIKELKKNILNRLSEIFSDKLKKDIRYVSIDGNWFSDKGSGFYLFENGEKGEMLLRVRISIDEFIRKNVTIKSTFMRTKNVTISLNSIEINLKLP